MNKEERKLKPRTDKDRIIERLKGNTLKKSKFMGREVEWVSDNGGALDTIFGDTEEDEKRIWDELEDDKKWQ